MSDDTAPPAAVTPSLNEAVGASVGNPSTDTRGTVVSLGAPTFFGTQRQIAFMLLYIMIGVIAIITIMSLGYSVGCSRDVKACPINGNALKLLNDSMSPIFTAMIGLVGSVVGFYFGSKQGGS